MAERRDIGKAGAGGNGERPEEKAAPSPSDECRCKEARNKTMPQVLKLMLEDLAFWRKRKKPGGKEE